MNSTSNRVRRIVGAALAALLALPAGLVATAADPSPAGAQAPPAELRLRALATSGGPGHAGLYGWGAATMRDGSVLVSDYWNLRVQRFAADGTPLGTFVANGGHAANQHQAIYGMAVDPVSGDVYLADTDKYQIDRYSETGAYLGTFGSQGEGPGRFKYPARVAIGPDRRVYVADMWENRISVHQPDGTELFDFGGGGSQDGRINQPRGMDFDAGGLLYVADHGNREIDVFDAEGTWVREIGAGGTGPGQIRGDMRGLVVDPAGGLVYAVDGADDQILVYGTDGRVVREFGGTGSGPGQFLDGGREIALDGAGNLWVGDMPNFRVQVFAPDGTPLFSRPDPPAPPPPGGFNAPRGVAVDAAGNTFVTDTYNQRIQKLAPDGSFVTAWGSRGRDDAAFNYPRMLAIDPATQDVLVADTDNHQIKRFTNDGAHLWTVGENGGGDGQFRNPHGVDVAADGTIAVADSNNDRIVILGPDGGFVRAFGSSGTTDGRFQFPRGVAFGPDGTVWAADSNRNDVQHFTADGTFLGTVGSGAVGPTRLDKPFDVEVDGEHVYVASTAGHQVKAFTPAGALAAVVGGLGAQLGQLRQPDGLDLGPDGDLHVVEEGNERVTRFTARDLPSEGAVPTALGEFGGPGHADVYPSGVETLPDGGLVVADTGNGLLKRYDPAGTLLWTVGQRDSGLGALEHPRDVAVDPATGHFYVADGGTSRIAVYDANGTFRFDFLGPDNDRIGAAIGLTIANNLVFVADGAKRKIRVFNMAGAQVRQVAETTGCAFSQVRDVAADSTNNLYVANYTNNDILKISINGTCIGKWGTRGQGPGQFMNPYGVTVKVDPVTAQERVFVADSNNNRVQVFTKAGAHLATLGTAGPHGTPGTFTALRRVAVAPDGDVWGADLWGARLERFDRTADGWVPASSIGAFVPPLQSDAVFNQVHGMAVDGGELLAVDTVNQRFVRFDAETGDLLGACGERGFAEIGGFNWPRGLAVDEVSGEVWIADTKQSRLQILRRDCTGLARVGSGGAGTNQFDWPHAIAMRESDRTAWVADTRNERVVAYDVATRLPLASFGTDGAGDGNLREPRGIAVDPVTGDILVADTGNGRVVRLHAAPRAASITWGGVVDRGLSGAEGVAADRHGRIYVAETGNDQVRVLDAAGTLTGVLREGFDGPAALHVDDAGRLYVADTHHDRVRRFAFPGDPPPPVDPELTYVRDIVGDGAAGAYPVDVEATANRYYVVDPGNFQVLAIDRAGGEVVDSLSAATGFNLGAARALEVDAGGDVWVADTGQNQIVHLDADLNVVRTFSSTGTGPGQVLRPYGIAVGPGAPALGDPSEVVYVVDDTNRIQVFSRSGLHLRTFAGNGVLDHPRQIDIHPATGELFVVNARQRQVVVFTPEGTVVRRFGGQGTGPGQFSGDPRGIVVSAAGQVYVTDAGGERVNVFTDGGDPVGQVGGPDRFVDPRGVALTGDGGVVVADEWDYSVKEFAPDGSLARRLLGTPPSPVGVNYPRGLTVDQLGRLYTIDHWNMRVLRVNADGTGHLTFGFRGTQAEPGSLNFPWDVAIEPATGRAFVANREGHEIVVFGPDGEFVTRWGTRGSALGQLEFPVGVEFDRDGTLLVADSQNDRVVRYAVDAAGTGTALTSYGQSGNRQDGPGFVNEVSDIAVEPDGTFWIADSFNQSVQRRDPDGTWSRFTDPAGPYAEPRGITFGPDGNVWVADSRNDRLVVLDPDLGTTVALHDGSTTGAGTIDYPGDIAFGPSGQVYVSDGINSRVVELAYDAPAPADATIATPGRDEVAAAPLVPITGTAAATAGVAAVEVAIQDRTSREWLQPDGSFGVYTRLTAAGTADWAFEWASAPPGAFLAQVTATDTAGQQDPTPALVPFTVLDPNPSGQIVAPAAGAEVTTPVVEVVGVAQAQAGVGQATVAIRDEGTGEWYQPDGTWGPAEARLPVALEAPEAPETGWSFAFERPDPGLYVIELTVVDLAGSTNATPVQRSFWSLLPPPEATVEAPGLDETVVGAVVPLRGRATAPEGVVEVGVAIKDRVTGLWWRADGTWGAFQRHAATVALPDSPDTTWSFDWASPGPGSYGVQVRAVDAAGLPDPEPAWQPFAVAAGPPDGAIAFPASAGTATTPTVPMAGTATASAGVAAVRVAIQDQVSRLWWRADGTWGAWQQITAEVAAPGATSTAWSYDWAVPGPGAYNVQLDVTDGQGAADPVRAFHGFTVVTAEPDGVITTPAPAASLAGPGLTMDGTASAPAGVARVQVAIKDRTTGLWWRADGSWGGFQRHDTALASPGAPATAWSFPWTAPADGAYAVQLNVVDTAGAVDETRAYHPFDVTGPPPPGYLTVLMARMMWQGNESCQPVAGYVPMDRVAAELAGRGLAATGAVVTGRTEETTRRCQGNYEFASWQDLARLRDERGWTMVSTGALHENMLTMTPAQQQAESCATLQTLDAHGHDRAWGLFGWPNNRYSTELQQSLVSTCFSFGRRYSGAPNRRTEAGPPWFLNATPADGGNCADAGAGCPDVDHTGDGTIDAADAYRTPEYLAQTLAPAPGEYRLVQYYRFVEGSRTTGEFQWDCTSSDPDEHWTSRRELYCFDDFVAALDMIPPGTVVTDPATVAEAWGRGDPNA